MESSVPFEIRLSVTEGPGLRAVLKNRSNRKQVYLHEEYVQPSELVLASSSGAAVRSYDTRSEMKYDNTAYRAMYQPLAPDREAVLGEARFEKSGPGAYTIEWGPFRFADLSSGAYRARVVWKSEKDSYTESDSGKKGRLKDVWKGTVTSNTVEVVLP
jgi:hypothetical protein